MENHINMSYQLQNKELKIKVQKDLTTYMNYSLPLCAILADDGLYPWFYQHFVQLYTSTDEMGNLWADYLEKRDFYKDIAENFIYDCKSLSDEKDILGFIINKINSGYYVIMFVDEYYLPRKSSYMSNHFMHQLMIYGYNNDTSIFKTIGFDEKKEFRNDDYTYEQIQQAYELGKNYYESSPVWVLNETVEIIRLKDITNSYKFDMGLFLNELNTYLSGQGEYSKIRPNNLKTNGTRASFNFKIFDELDFHLNNLIKGKCTMDYRFMHLLFEHKSIMHKRLEYIASSYKSSDRLVSLLQEYKEGVVRRTLVARNLFFKQTIMKENDSSDAYYDIKILLSLIDIVRLAKEQEKKILTSIYNELKN